MATIMCVEWDEAVRHARAIVRQANRVLVGGFDPHSNGAVPEY
jgi:hypothetical protein